jgi:hypothetical protein
MNIDQFVADNGVKGKGKGQASPWDPHWMMPVLLFHACLFFF